ncbi:MAG: class I SAM-dependent methyltransferase [Verrucomicrobia subdivision 3 bacterium]|nr:class I SAM-dependent methyltransferase [Limisphaerales bacterium]
MTTALSQHQVEIERNLTAWQKKPLLQHIYSGFYERIAQQIDPAIPGTIIEVGSGIGNLKSKFPQAIATDLFPNPWLDLVCDGYELPFADGSASHLVLFDVFHHLRAPIAFLREARRVLHQLGRLILFEPYISALSYPVYGLLHHEPVALRAEISTAQELSRPRNYYAAQGNATRLFFHLNSHEFIDGWTVIRADAFCSFSYLLSGGFSKPSAYPPRTLPLLQRLDRTLSRWPELFGARCLVALQRSTPA